MEKVRKIVSQSWFYCISFIFFTSAAILSFATGRYEVGVMDTFMIIGDIIMIVSRYKERRRFMPLATLFMVGATVGYIVLLLKR